MITGLDLNNKLSNDQKLIKAITDHLVICIKNQNLSCFQRYFSKKIFFKDEILKIFLRLFVQIELADSLAY